MLKTWDVYVVRDGHPQCLGQVRERTESLARCAALHRFGVGDDPSEPGEADDAIGPEDEFQVSRRTQAHGRLV